MATATPYVTYGYTNLEVQALTQDAIDLVTANAPTSNDPAVFYKHQLLVSYLNLFKLFSASGNSIPTLGGKGLEEGLVVVQSILAGEVYRVDFKHLAEGFDFI